MITTIAMTITTILFISTLVAFHNYNNGCGADDGDVSGRRGTTFYTDITANPNTYIHVSSYDATRNSNLSCKCGHQCLDIYVMFGTISADEKHTMEGIVGPIYDMLLGWPSDGTGVRHFACPFRFGLLLGSLYECLWGWGSVLCQWGL